MKIKQLTPTFERVLVKIRDAESITKGGIILPDEVQDVPNIGTVISIGHKAKEYVPNLKEGDTIMVLKHSGLIVEINEQKYRLVLANDIIAIVNEFEE